MRPRKAEWLRAQPIEKDDLNSNSSLTMFWPANHLTLGKLLKLFLSQTGVNNSYLTKLNEVLYVKH